MANFSKRIIYLTEAQRKELFLNETITVNGVTIDYDENDIYITPQEMNMTIGQITTLPSGANATASISGDPENMTLDLGIPKGDKGDKGDPGQPGTNMEIHICSITEYDAETRMPTIVNPDSSTFYLVPTEDGASPDLFTEWVYVNNAWEMFGSASVDLTDYVKNTDIATTDDFGIIKIGMGLKKSSDNKLYTDYADGLAIKTGTNNYRPITPYYNKESTFYGLAKASGDTTQSQSDNPVGTYTDKAKASIQSMLGTEPKLEKIYTTILDTTITTVIDEEHNYPYTSYSNVTINEQYKYRITLNDIVVESSVGIWYENRNNGVKGISFIGNPNLYNDKIPKVINSLPNQTFCLVYIGDLTDNYFQVYTSEAGKYNLKIERITYNKSQLPYSLIYGNDEAPIKRIYNNSSYQSIDIGHNALISRGSVAIGSFNTVSKEFGVAIGMLNNVSSENAIAVGLNTTASGNSSYAEGKTTTASGDNSHAEGVNSIASGYGSHAEGDATQATGINAHSEGFKSVASSNYSHSEGYETKASKPYSHSEGANTLAGGNVSHAEGYGTQATGMCSHAEGNSTIASNANQHVQGIFNIKDLNNTYADIVGNGDSDNNRSNAYALDWSGNGHYMGDVYVGANTDSTGGTKVATINDIPEVPVDDVQINGTSIVEDGVANVPIATTTSAGAMSAQDKSRLDAVYADYTSALTALGVI